MYISIHIEIAIYSLNNSLIKEISDKHLLYISWYARFRVSVIKIQRQSPCLYAYYCIVYTVNIKPSTQMNIVFHRRCIRDSRRI